MNCIDGLKQAVPCAVAMLEPSALEWLWLVVIVAAVLAMGSVDDDGQDRD